MVFLGPILTIAAIVTTVLLVLLSEASDIAKMAAVLICIGIFVLPGIAPSTAVFAGPAKAVLSIVIIIYLKFERLIK